MPPPPPPSGVPPPNPGSVPGPPSKPAGGAKVEEDSDPQAIMSATATNVAKTDRSALVCIT
jgi:hypothetical protein